MDEFLDCKITDYESLIVLKIIERLMKEGIAVPTTDDIMHELIRLSEIAIKHFSKEAY